MDVDAAAQRIAIAQGTARCRVDYLEPRGLTIDQHDQFTQPPVKPSPNQWHLTASTSKPAQETTSLIVLQPHRATDVESLAVPHVESGNGCVGVTLTSGERTVTVVLRTDHAVTP